MSCQDCEYYRSSCECEFCYGKDCKFHECRKLPQYENLKSFPFKKKMPCFKLNFWLSEFADKICGDDVKDELVFKAWREQKDQRTL